MINPILKQTIFISLLGHITLFSMFGFSFGPKVPEANFAPVCFWGNILRSSDLISIHSFDTGYKRGGFSGKSEIAMLDKINRQNLYNNWQEKPPASLTFNQEKIVFTQKLMLRAPLSEKKEPAIMFYPRLPYHFALYFKDRQAVHIELSFEVISSDKRNLVLVKRKISSGNLEADLLSMRYISRYLFIQQRGLTPNKWEIVKIDLSPKEY